LPLDDAAQKRVQRRLGYTPARASYTFYVARSDGHVDGYALIDEEKGEHLPITFAVKLSSEGKVERQEIVVYRESRGDEVRDEHFRHQFVGKTARDAIDTDQDIMAISGATISSRAMAIGVKRAVVLFDELVKPTKVAQAGH
jgi:electron transport complex protein RnfG